MKRLMILSAVGALILGGAGTYALTRPADAQDAPGPAKADWPHGWRGAEDGQHGWGGGPHGRFHHHWMMAHKGFGLFYPVADKNLSVTDVQTIAQAMLLRHGNHTWKVANVAQNQDNTVSFAFTTADGGVVARFAIDTQSGHIRRVG
jgi:hypothetical protein